MPILVESCFDALCNHRKIRDDILSSLVFSSISQLTRKLTFRRGNQLVKQKSLAHNFIVYCVRILFTGLTPLLIFPYASHMLGVTGIGQVSYAQSIATYFEQLAVLGMNYYAVREGAKCREDSRKFGKLVTELLLVNTITTAISASIYIVAVCSVTQLQPYRVLLLLFSLEVIAKGLGLDWFYNTVEDYDYITKRTILFQIVDVAVLLLFVRTERDVIAYAIVLFLPFLLTSLTNLRNMSNRVALFGYGKYSLWKHFVGSARVFVVIVSTMVYTLMDTTMLGYMQGDYSVGLYTSASKLAKMCVQLITAMCAVFLPRLAVCRANEETEKFQDLSTTAFNVILGLAIPATVGMYMLSEPFILIFSGRDFIEAVPAMKVLSYDFIFSAINGFLAWQVMIPYNQEKSLLSATILGALLDFILNFMWIPHYAEQGAAWATLLAEAVIFILLVFKSQRYVPFERLTKVVWQYVVASVPIVGICWGAKQIFNSVFAQVGVAAVISVGVYAVILYLIKNEIIREYTKILLEKVKKS